MKNRLCIHVILFVLLGGMLGCLEAISFLATADPHAGASWAEQKAEKQIPIMKALINNPENDIKAVLFPGDLTDHAYTGFDVTLSQWRDWMPISFIKELLPEYPPSTEVVDELGILQKQWVEPFVKASDLSHSPELHLSIGNHDVASRARNILYTLLLQKTVVKAIASQSPNHKTYYHFKHDPVHFFCCAVYPGQEVFRWFIKKLKVLQIQPGEPVVIYFHYHVASDWWEQEDKDAFYQIIKDLNAFVVTGHKHRSYATKWNNQIPMINVSGKEFALCSYNQEGKTFDVNFYDYYGKAYDWNSRYVYPEKP